MIDITLNGEARSVPEPITLSELVDRLGVDPQRIAIEVNRELVPRIEHAARRLIRGDAVEIVTLVGGGQPDAVPEFAENSATPPDKPLVIGKFTVSRQRLRLGPT